MANLIDLLKKCNPDPTKAGKTLLVINALGMVFAALSNTYAAAVDKNTSAEDKKFLVPAGFVTGAANIGLYYAMTDKIIKGLKISAEAKVDKLSPEELTEKATVAAKSMIEKAGKKLFKGKDHEQYVKSMKETLFKGGDIAKGITDQAEQIYKNNAVAAAGVTGAFIGAVVGCAILTPIIRDISAYFVQKRMEKKNPQMKEIPYKPYFEPTRIESHRYGNSAEVGNKQPLTMKSYMAFTNGNMKI